ncbi:hypothetical protein QNI23_013800 [Bermanella sp. WJH001]|uniref:hypothetical protein n=1 Tax=Bermanella sp. WJH001 TaxID=3048005 RepID=UPI0024BD6177|nr:hypothetical protein [Bermanella sp. WJH001]MDJ1538066.1 hypothetical protein [Bermanella sp. WJH001]
MKSLVMLLMLLVSISSLGRGLDYSLFQYPVEDAKQSAQSPYPTFVGYIFGDNKERRIPGLQEKHLDVIKQKYRIKVLNEFRLYEQSEMGIDEKILLERYCTRYNRQLVNLLGL